MHYCKCLEVREREDAVRDIREEWDELLDEVSDVMFGVGRLVAGIFGKVYIRMPFDKRHVMKIEERMESQGCVRSARRIANGDGCS